MANKFCFVRGVEIRQTFMFLQKLTLTFIDIYFKNYF